MALFKIFKGSETNNILKPTIDGVTNPNYKVPVDGYAYYDTSSKLFYIDAEYPGVNGITRQPINAAYSAYSGNALNGAFYGVCTTQASTSAKVVTLYDPLGFQLVEGVTVIVKFMHENTALNTTLNVNETGAKTIYRYETTGPGNTPNQSWYGGSVVSFTYDGTNWLLTSDGSGAVSITLKSWTSSGT